jgi:hypothetical protein
MEYMEAQMQARHDALDDYWNQDIAVRLLDRAKFARQESTGTAVADAAHFEEAAAEIKTLRAGIKRLSDEEELCAETTGDNPFSMVYLAAKIANTEAECERLRAAMKQVEDYHRAKCSEIWEVQRDGLSDDQKKEYGIAWCVHAASAYVIKTLITPEASGGDHG